MVSHETIDIITRYIRANAPVHYLNIRETLTLSAVGRKLVCAAASRMFSEGYRIWRPRNRGITPIVFKIHTESRLAELIISDGIDNYRTKKVRRLCFVFEDLPRDALDILVQSEKNHFNKPQAKE